MSSPWLSMSRIFANCAVESIIHGSLEAVNLSNLKAHSPAEQSKIKPIAGYVHSVLFLSLCCIILFSHVSFYPSCICSISSCSVSFTWGIRLQMSIKESRSVTESTALCFNHPDCFRQSQS